MSEITGRLHADLFPDGTVRMVFIQIVGGGSETSLTAKIRDSNNIVAVYGERLCYAFCGRGH
jgi:hypothetical protein